jgi:aminocarboxymuconate-semialdehyde decarboxylase
VSPGAQRVGQSAKGLATRHLGEHSYLGEALATNDCSSGRNRRTDAATRAGDDILGRVIVDVHSHCIPVGFRTWLGERGPSLGVHVVESDEGAVVRFRNQFQTGAQFGWPSLTDTADRLAAMDRMGIDLQVLSGWIDLVGYEVDDEHALEYATAHNETLTAEQARHPDRFRALGTVPLQTPGLAVETLTHAMDELGMAGIQLATTVRGRYLHDVDGLDALWAAAEERRALIVLHPRNPLGGIDLGRYFLHNTVGRPAETTIALAGLIMSGVFERFPDLTLCAVHGGGFVPFQIGRLDQAFHQVPGIAGQRLDTPPSRSMRHVYTDTIVHDRESLAFLVRRMGDERVLLGTDYPFPMGDHDPVAMLRSTPGLSQRDIDRIAGDNAIRLLG